MTTLRQLGEWEVIRRLAKTLPSREDVKVGIGDDVAVVAAEGTHYDFLLTSDAVVEGTHFLSSAKAERVGHKAIGRVLSDFAAMGGEPLWALIDLVAPPEASFRRIEGIYRGAARLAAKYSLAIVGGDTTAGPDIELHIFGVGRLPHNSAIRRSGAAPGDLIYVTGTLGGSLAGKHLAFEPRIEEGLWLRESRWPSAMIDISDGLVTDLGHILDMSGAGAELAADRVPIAKAARGGRSKRTPLERALYDGEDFELLFTVPAEKKAAFESSWRETFRLPCAEVGRVTGQRGRIVLAGREKKTLLKNKGYEHFRAGGVRNSKLET